MAYFPFMKDIEGWQVLVVGGGREAFHKVRAFQGFGAHIRVIAPDMCSDIRQSEGVEIVLRDFRPEDLAGADLVAAATRDKEKNRQIYRAAKEAGIPANAVDDVEYCDFIFPAIIRKDNYTVAVSTDGKSPLFARKIKEIIGTAIPQAYDYVVGELGKARESVKARYSSPKERTAAFEEMAERLLKEREE